MIYNGIILFLFLKERNLFINSRILLSLSTKTSYCYKNIRFDAIITPRSLSRVLLSFTPHILQSDFWFLLELEEEEEGEEEKEEEEEDEEE